MSREWRAVPGYEGSYEVSDDGAVRSMPRTALSRWGTPRDVAGCLISPRAHLSGHLQVSLWRDATSRTLYVHRLVLMAFVGLPPDGLVACHNDGNPTNNSVSNLRWDTPASNAQDTVRHGANPNTRKTTCKRGHPFDAQNTYFGAQGRSCKACRAAAARALRAGKTSANGPLADQGAAR